MPDNAHKKEKQRLKRKKKAEKLRRERGRSAFEQAAKGGKIITILICDDWKQSGQAVMWMLRSVPDRLPVMASYMIDLWCAGLKDAWGNQNVDHETFRGGVERMADGTGLTFVPCPPELARRLLAGSVRFARQNGFRLPQGWQRWAALLDVTEADTSSADLADFTKNGKLMWTAPLSDLRQRLVGSSVEEFLARPDVEAVFELEDDSLGRGYADGDGEAEDGDDCDDYDDDDDDDDYEEEEEGGDDEEMSKEELAKIMADASGMVVDKMLDSLRSWCFSTGRLLHHRAEEALTLVIASSMLAAPGGPKGKINRREGEEFVETALSELPVQERLEVRQALDQVQEFLANFDSSEAFAESIGLGPDEDDEGEEEEA